MLLRRADGSTECVDPTTAILLNAGESVERTALEVIPAENGRPIHATRCVFLEYDPVDVDQALGSGRFPRRVVPSPAGAILRSRQLAGRVRMRTAESGPTAPAELHDELALGLLRDTARALADAESARRPGARQCAIVERAREYLAHRLASPITVTELARAIGVSRFHLVRLFRRHTGLSLREYILQVRLFASLDHLQAYRGDLTSLALALGFYDHSHFTRAFRSLFGVPPSSLVPRQEKQRA